MRDLAVSCFFPVTICEDLKVLTMKSGASPQAIWGLKMERVEDLVRAGKFSEASLLCQDLELRIGSVAAKHCVKFHCLYMASLLAIGCVEEARYLWLRAPAQIKDSEFTAVWNVAESLRVRDVRAAQAAAKANATIFSPALAAVIEHVMECLRADELRAVSQAYSCISLADLASHLGLTPEEAAQRVRALDAPWAVTDDEPPRVFPSSQAANADGASLERQLRESTERAKALSTVVAHLDTKPVRAELSASAGYGGLGRYESNKPINSSSSNS